MHRRMEDHIPLLIGLRGTPDLADIRSIEPTGRSLRPEGWRGDLKEDERRDLFAHLGQSQPFTR